MRSNNAHVAVSVGDVERKLGPRLIKSIGIQAIGPISLFLLVWFLGRFLGPEQQARFSELKSVVDVCVAVLVFGFPQSVIYAVHKYQVVRGVLAHRTLCYGGLLCIIIGGLLVAKSPPFVHTSFDMPVLLLPLACGAGIAGLVVHGILRGILLTENDGARFALITVCPPVLLCGFLAGTVHVGTYDPVFAYFLTGVTCAVASILLLNARPQKQGDKAVPWILILSNGSGVFIQGVLSALLPAAAFYIARDLGATSEDIAFISIGLYVYQAGTLPITMVGPLLFNRWAGNKSGSSLIQKDMRVILALAVPVFAIVLLGAWITPTCIELALGPAYAPAASPVALMLMAVPFAYFFQVSAAIFMAKGAFYTNAIMALVRLFCFVFAFYGFFMTRYDSMVMVAVYAWFSAEVTSAICSSMYAWLKVRPTDL